MPFEVAGHDGLVVGTPKVRASLLTGKFGQSLLLSAPSSMRLMRPPMSAVAGFVEHSSQVYQTKVTVFGFECTSSGMMKDGMYSHSMFYSQP